MRRLLLFLVLSSTLLAQQNIPAALSGLLEQWKSAVAMGDSATIFALYSTNPRGYVVGADGKQQLPIADETTFWTAARS